MIMRLRNICTLIRSLDIGIYTVIRLQARRSGVQILARIRMVSLLQNELAVEPNKPPIQNVQKTLPSKAM
jgi:hypothetical protein